MTKTPGLQAMALGHLIAYGKHIQYPHGVNTDVFPARSSLLRVLSEALDQGDLVLTEGSEEYRFGRGSKAENHVHAAVRIKSQNFWVKVFLRNDLGFAEAYMDGDFESPDLKSVLYVTGYDCSNDFFKIFLSEDMTYSCALWTDKIGGVRGDLEGNDNNDSLRDAQLNKIHHILELARIKQGDRLLEFGSGWGSMAIEAAKKGCTVDTITLSVEQKRGAEERIREAGLQDRITVHLVDYRRLPPEFEGVFDAFVSVEMVEIVDWALKPNKGVAVIQLTTQPESRYTVYQSTDYARTYQWPNSFLPSATSFISTATSSTNGRLCLESTFDYGTHYPRTLRDWRRRLQANWNDALAAKLRLRHSELASDEALEGFKRKWEYMCIYAEVGYARAYTSLHIISKIFGA
ncbi:hypothetical protein CVT25_008989 [Psilocybe cyanescens]|uniref:Cyclopropane-fatty-acyl-phospholipid synthase n=1 Tax=Psilocybe cyanescens TaxID=93625 RepID=A0A409XN23_PSICY|nr:hypothetical protein CVT25_008989 [Psilocybe cyanescens]